MQVINFNLCHASLSDDKKHLWKKILEKQNTSDKLDS